VLGEERAWGWVAHLREGGSTPWREWSEHGESQGRYLPGAQQLELLRRLNAAGSPPRALADRVLAASAAGRGRPDLELVDAVPPSDFGPQPVDPAALPAKELIRVAASVLADQLAAEGLPAGRGDARPSRWRRGYRLVGDPQLADPLRAQLVARGRAPGGREPRILVLGSDLASLTAHVWVHRAFTDGGPSWREWLRLIHERGELPPRADLLATVRTWERRVGKERVHVVLDLEALPELVGDRRSLETPTPLPGEAGELARKVGSVLGLLVLPDARDDLLRHRLRPRVAAHAAATRGAPLVVPAPHREWLSTEAERMRERLSAAGYAVHGDLDALVPRWAGESEDAHGPSLDVTLDLAARVLLDDRSDRVAEEQGGEVRTA
jgi:hypothetical protein